VAARTGKVAIRANGDAGGICPCYEEMITIEELTEDTRAPDMASFFVWGQGWVLASYRRMRLVPG
jgi:hypothetical protein